jgi:hypothetical protein
MCKYVPAQESSKDLKQIENFACEIAKNYQFNFKTESIKDFVKKLGGEILIDDSLLTEYKNISGSLTVEAPEKFVIRLSPFTGILRDNFTIAHELGHYFLHSGFPYGSIKIQQPRWGKGILEQQANRFAASLLMPEKEFREIAKKYENNPVLLAGYFNVSIQAAVIRLKLLSE